VRDIKVNIKGRFVELSSYPECTQFVTTDVTLGEDEVRDAKITLKKVQIGGQTVFQLCVYDGAVPTNCPETRG
jgi:hypothetical protein